ncbi:hypothetical protein [Motiliproteus sp. MSK22-1]|uniref:hypothetical protein n=1 Tax=Motiliproteus sp. MSK22-1 TaxID=1897630 RepID=UPI001E3FA751|nr:hypothetical protein [Motiliproteus sp. MSK22-1]
MALEFIKISSSGAYYATLSDEPDDARALLLQLLHADASYPYSDQLIMDLTGESQAVSERLFQSLLDRGLVELVPKPIVLVNQSLERTLPDLLPRLSSQGKVILADDQGFCLGNVGYEEEHAEQLAALSADIMSLHLRHKHLLNQELNLMGESWALVDPLGQSQLGVWVFQFSKKRFVLLLEGIPKLNDSAFVYLIGALARRYLED